MYCVDAALVALLVELETSLVHEEEVVPSVVGLDGVELRASRGRVAVDADEEVDAAVRVDVTGDDRLDGDATLAALDGEDERFGETLPAPLAARPQRQARVSSLVLEGRRAHELLETVVVEIEPEERDRTLARCAERELAGHEAAGPVGQEEGGRLRLPCGSRWGSRRDSSRVRSSPRRRA